MKVTKASKMKIARELSYKTVTGLLPVLQRFADSLGVYDINELSDIICNMSVDEFCDFKFRDAIADDLAEALCDELNGVVVNE